MPSEALEQLLQAYSSPDRFYHTLTHLQDCLSKFDAAKSLARCPEQVELAVWFHDAIYDPKRTDNEQKSAEWASSVIHQSGLSSDIAESVSQLILATRHNSEVSDRDAQLLVDIDLSILGSQADFWQYEENIRTEYAWVPVDLFRQKRVEILRGFLERQPLYYLDAFREQFEVQARVNLRDAIAKLEDHQK
ncbi:hypothetical protein [Pseudanabaena sp. FACHB-2040]|uniref:HD domain-containing protein n=1 Tax=Pseudanabaena sp. FACHB-2040 TaxID=2692859 RepID=UPI0018EFC99F|nr:hypothetical protein [Pseudanabaena sp. FACHB-2040]